MQKDLKTYLREINTLLKKDKLTNKEAILTTHLLYIKLFQHERLVHLIVTVFVGIISILFFLAGIILSNIMILILFALTLALFIPYIFHYYFLENSVQKLYRQYWQLKQK